MSTTARYWRMSVSVQHTAGYITRVTSLEMRDNPAGANIAVTGNGTATASSVTGAFTAAKAFDSLTSTHWGASAGAPQWIYWDFGTDKTILVMNLIHGPSGTSDITGHPKSGTIETSPDGSTWTTWSTFTNINTAYGANNVFVTTLTGGSDIAAPLPTLTASIYGGANIAGTLPNIAGTIYGGANITAALPALTFSAYSAARLDATLPALTFYGAGHDSTGENALGVTLPSIGLTIYGGANLSAPLPALIGDATVTGTNWGSIDATLPALTGALTGTVSGMMRVAATLPALEMVGYFGSVISATIGKVTFAATGKGGAVGSIRATLPMLEVSASVTTENWGSIDAVLPAITTGNHGAIWALLPGLELTIIGTAVVEATYEAYALNLNHTPVPGQQQQPTDEMTRYTDFPFTHIVRYQNSYFGVAAGGLYLLEGTTDDGAEINYAVQTAKTDFGTPEKKTIAYAYFGGRMGAEATITLVVGESGTETYSYTTPRGEAAQNYRQAFGRGVKSRYYAIKVEGGAALELDTLDLNVDQLTRRI